MLCAIVDAYSTGRFLAREFRKYGMEPLHVQSQPEIPQFFKASFCPGEFLANIIHDGILSATADQLAAWHVTHVLPGAESGVTLAEALTSALRLPGNDKHTGGRRDKSLMATLLRQAGLDAPASLRTPDPAAAVAWANRRGNWPVAVKPVASAASDNVHICPDGPSLAAAVKSIMCTSNVLGAKNSAALVQEWLSGTEFAVNSVSHDGHHCIAEIWRYSKRLTPDGGVIYDYEEPVAPGEPGVPAVVNYAEQALTALGVAYGAAHSEVILTSRGPVLLETAGRIAGAAIPAAVAPHFGIGQFELTVRAVIDPDAFYEALSSPYIVRGCLRNVFLIAPQEGTLAADEQFGRLTQLPQFAGMSLSVRAGSRLRRTRDLGTSPGHVYLSASRPELIAAGYTHIRRLEATALYPLTGSARTAAGQRWAKASAPPGRMPA